MTAPILATSGLSAGYGKKRTIHGVDLTLGEGEILVVIGHNGAGKTTLMGSIFGLIPPQEGTVTYSGADITGRSPAANVKAGIAYVPQGHGIFRSLTVRDNLELGAFVESDSAAVAERLERIYALFPILKERASQVSGTFSGGQQQMLAIGMALMHGPRVLILDEPSIGLAPNLVERVMNSITTINKEMGTSIIMVEQNVKLSLPIAHRVVVMKTGGVVYAGDPEPLTDHVRLMQYF